MDLNSMTVPSQALEDLVISSQCPLRSQSALLRTPGESKKNDRRIRMYLSQIAERYDSVLKKSKQGFGLTIVDDLLLDNVKLLKVRSVYKNGPAAKTGIIQPGDIISAFNHIDIIGVHPEEVINMFKVIREKESITLTLWKISETRPSYPYDPSYNVIHFYLQKCDNGFGFILGNCNEEHQVAKVNGDGDVNLLLQTNDKLLAIGQVRIDNLSHDQVVSLLKQFPKNHFLQFTVRRDTLTLTSSISDDSCQLMDYSMNSSIYSKISKVADPNIYSKLPIMGASGPFNTPDFIPASHYLSLNRRNFPGPCENINCDSFCHSCSAFSSPQTPIVPEYTQPPDCIPESFQSSSFSTSADHIYVQITRSQTKGFGFRLMGGSDEGCQVYIGAIVPGGPMDQCGLVSCGDILTEINGQNTEDKSHAAIVSILEEAAKSLSGKLEFYIKKRPEAFNSGRSTPKADPDCRLVTLTRESDQGFGFVIVSAVNHNEPCGIGRINPNSVADRNPDLLLGDRILSVNGHSLQGLHYKDVMNMIKESELQISLVVRSGNINSLKTIKYELTNQQDPVDDRHGSAQEYSENATNMITCQPVSIMKSTSQFDNLYKYNPRECNVPLNSGGRSHSVKELSYKPQDPPSEDSTLIELQRTKQGFGFSIQGGADYDQKSLYVLKVSEDTEERVGHRMQAGDQILEINHQSTEGMTHAAAVEKIQSGGDTVFLLLRRPYYGTRMKEEGCY